MLKTLGNEKVPCSGGEVQMRNNEFAVDTAAHAMTGREMT